MIYSKNTKMKEPLSLSGAIAQSASGAAMLNSPFCIEGMNSIIDLGEIVLATSSLGKDSRESIVTGNLLLDVSISDLRDSGGNVSVAQQNDKDFIAVVQRVDIVAPEGYEGPNAWEEATRKISSETFFGYLQRLEAYASKEPLQVTEFDDMTVYEGIEEVKEENRGTQGRVEGPLHVAALCPLLLSPETTILFGVNRQPNREGSATLTISPYVEFDTDNRECPFGRNKFVCSRSS